jgi:hypothetical protein
MESIPYRSQDSDKYRSQASDDLCGGQAKERGWMWILSAQSRWQVSAHFVWLQWHMYVFQNWTLALINATCIIFHLPAVILVAWEV